MSVLDSFPPSLRERVQPLILTSSEVQNVSESRSLRPSSRVTISSGIRFLTIAAGISELILRVLLGGDLSSTVIVLLSTNKDSIVEQSTRFSPSAALSGFGIEELSL
jgi:hypothetical protein